ASPMTLLDNLTSQMPPERKEKFIDLFRQLQNDVVTANQFLSQARILLDQQQYQQLENLKNKPPPPRNVAIRPPIQPQPIMIPPQQNIIKQPMNSSQVRAEDAQRSMTGLMSPQAKRSKTTDIPNTNNNIAVALSAPSTPSSQPQQIQFQLNTADQTNSAKASEVEESSSPAITQDFMNTEMLTEKISKISKKLNPNVVTYIALSSQKRIQRLIQHMIMASKHRTESQTFTQPPVDETGHHPFKIVDVQDIKKQLLAVERVEREEERKRKEAILERERKAHMGEEGGDAGDDESRPAKKKKKKEMGPGVTARYMSDDVRNKTTNETALMIAGGV
ncbi:MAG: transcription initiation factor TFIID component TAF4 family-domain-containing protein, partial [Benjaminiella poitrasii]